MRRSCHFWVVGPVTGLKLVPLTLKRSQYGPHKARGRQNRSHVTEKACIFLFLTILRPSTAGILRVSLEKTGERFGPFSKPLFYQPAWRSEIRFFLKSISAIASSSRARSGWLIF